MKCRPALTFFLVLWAALSLPLTAQVLPDSINPLSSTTENPAHADSEPSTLSLPENPLEVATQRQAFREQVSFPPEEGNGTSAEISRVRLIYEIDAAFEDQINTLNQLAEIREQLEIDAPPAQWKEVSSIGYLNAPEITLEHLDQLHAIKNQIREKLRLATQEIIAADRNLDLARQAASRASKEGDTIPSLDPEEATKQAIYKELDQLAKQSVEERYNLRQLQARLASESRQLLEQKSVHFKDFFSEFLNKVIIREDQIQDYQDEYSIKETELNQSLILAQNAAASAEKRFKDLKSNLPANPTPLQALRLQTLEKERDAARARVSLNQTWITHQNIRREIFLGRIRFFQNKLTIEDMVALKKKLEPEARRLKAEENFLLNRIKQIEEHRDRLKIQSDAHEGEGTLFLEKAWSAAYDQFECTQEEFYSVQSTLAQVEIFLTELKTRTGKANLETATTRTNELLESAWDYELFRIKENRFTVGTLIWITLSIIAASILCILFSHFLARAIFSRLHMGVGQIAALRKLSYYILLVLSIIIIFTAFGFPLTSLTVVSGILALAIGFGSQEIIKNFMSGLILLIERPVHHGDIIEVDGRVLTVESIGARSTRMRDYDSSEKIVPNSFLIENIITNRTLSDDGFRSAVEVGVAYGSPTRKVSELLREAVVSVENVRETPNPYVIFTSFGDNALIFTVYFWCPADSRLSTSSEVRHRIAEILEEAGITVAFPQRDIHLDTLRPLQIEMSPPGCR